MKNKQKSDLLDNIEPSEFEKDQMLTKILNQNNSLKMNQGRSRRNRLLIPVIVSLLWLVIFCVIYVKEGYLNTGTSQNKISDHEMAAKASEFGGFVLTAYAAEKEDTYLSANYEEDSAVTVLQPEIKVLLANYSPIMNSVPGLPFNFAFNKSESNFSTAYSIKITMDEGELLAWDSVSGAITNLGNSVTCKAGDTLYWTPVLNSEENAASNPSIEEAKESNITVVALKDGTEVGRQIITITEDAGNYYATVGEFEGL